MHSSPQKIRIFILGTKKPAFIITENETLRPKDETKIYH
jgi:hypothetical protein